MREVKTPVKRRHICSMPGCRERDTLRFTKSEGAMGFLFLCRSCIKEIKEKGDKDGNK